MAGQANIRILIVEDLPSDAELELRELERAGIAFEARRVETAWDYRRELEHFRPDLIIADFSLPQFDGLQALAIARDQYPDMPFIFVSGSIGEEDVIRALKHGANDYVMKTNLMRLSSAVERAIQEQKERAARRNAESALRASELRKSAIFQAALDAIVTMDAQGHVVEFNPAAERIFDYTREEALGKELAALMIPPASRMAHRKGRLHYLTTGEGPILGKRIEVSAMRKDGSEFPVELTVVPIKLPDQTLFSAHIRDITERQEQEQKIARLSRIQAVLSGINSAIVRIRDRQDLFKEACRIAVEHGEFSIGWIAVLDPASGTLIPVAQAGLPMDLVAGKGSSDSPRGLVPRGTAEEALREHRPAFDNDIARGLEQMRNKVEPDTLRVRETAIRLGAKSVIVLPLFVEARTFGVLTLYAPELNFFDAEEIKLLSELAGDISFSLEFIAKKEKVDYLAYYDPLTGLPNHSLFSERLSQQLHTRADTPELVAVALIDVERLHMINDTLGRQAGDELLRQISRRLEAHAASTRCSNPARVVADCFAVIMRGGRDANEVANLLAAGMKACFGSPFVINGQEFLIVARAGVSAYPADGSTAESLLHNAEVALEKAKEAKERFVFYAPEMNARVAEMLTLESKLRKAIELEQFVLHYQPQVDVSSGKITGVEALIRWNDPDSGVVPPLRFIPILEETGMIFEVGRWALRRALADQQRWRGMGLPIPRVAVNVSAQQLRDQNFVQDVQLAMATQEGMKPALELEITESLLMEDIERNIDRLKTLRAVGVTIAIDDFGTGYSSLNYLARLPMDVLKIDRTFVMGMSASPENRTIVSTIISLAHSLALKVVAEGVEKQEQLDILKALKCDEMQGYLISRPIPPDELMAFLRGQVRQLRIVQRDDV